MTTHKTDHKSDPKPHGSHKETYVPKSDGTAGADAKKHEPVAPEPEPKPAPRPVPPRE